MLRWSPLLAAALLLLMLGSSSGYAQEARSESARVLSADLHEAQRAHLWRVAAWGGANVLGGLVLMGASTRGGSSSARWHFGAMSSGWGVVNVGIATAGLLATPDAPLTDPAAALSAERQFHDILLLNLGLNVGYAAVGGTMLAAGYRGIDNAARWRGFGSSLILQGAGLLALDGVAFIASRTRLASLLDTTAQVSVQAAPNTLALNLHF